MKLATRAQGTPDGELLVVSRDGGRCLPAGPRWPNLLAAIERWEVAEPALRALAARLAAGEGLALDPHDLRAPLPRSWQWLDGSAFPVHGELMEVAFNAAPHRDRQAADVPGPVRLLLRPGRSRALSRPRAGHRLRG